MNIVCTYCGQQLVCDDSLDGCPVECCCCRKTFVAEAVVFFTCPGCGIRFFVPEDADAYMFNCPSCSSLLDVTQLEPN